MINVRKLPGYNDLISHLELFFVFLMIKKEYVYTKFEWFVLPIFKPQQEIMEFVAFTQLVNWKNIWSQ